jgi:hypothetical protein
MGDNLDIIIFNGLTAAEGDNFDGQNVGLRGIGRRKIWNSQKNGNK